MIDDSSYSIHEQTELILRALRPEQLELATGYVFHEHGWNVELSPDGGDGGYDMELETHSRRCLVQVKSGATKIGPKVIREGAGAALAQQADEIAFVSISGYTQGAVEEAHKILHNSKIRNVELTDCETLVNAVIAIPESLVVLEGIYKNLEGDGLLLNNQMTLTEYWSHESLEAERRKMRNSNANMLENTSSMFTIAI